MTQSTMRLLGPDGNPVDLELLSPQGREAAWRAQMHDVLVRRIERAMFLPDGGRLILSADAPARPLPEFMGLWALLNP